MQRDVLLEYVSREMNWELCLSGEIFPGLEWSGNLSTQPEIRLFEIFDRYIDDLIGISFDLEIGEADVVRISGEKAREPIDLKRDMFLIVRELRTREADRKPIELAEEDRFLTDSVIAPTGPDGRKGFRKRLRAVFGLSRRGGAPGEGRHRVYGGQRREFLLRRDDMRGAHRHGQGHL